MNAPESKIPFPLLPNTSYGGGLYAGRFVLGEDVFGLVAAPADGGELAATPWGKAKRVSGALFYNDGLVNTAAMADAGSTLAQWAQGLRIGGFADWYIPSRLEALILFGAIGTVGGFAREWHWTSTQYADDAGYAWFQSFYYGHQHYGRKGSVLRARAVRRFPIR